MRERQEFIDRYFVFSDSEYDVPVDYSRTRGLLGEILSELMQQDTDRKIALDAQKRPEIGHFPQDPIGNGVARSANGQNDGEQPGQPPTPGQGLQPPAAQEPTEAVPSTPEAPQNFVPNAPPPPEAIQQLAPPPVIAPEESQ